MEFSKIEWTTHTHNPWVGCQAVSPACDHCYAEANVRRWGGDFSARRHTSKAIWAKPRRWQREAAQFLKDHGHRPRVFCASMADVFDNQVPPVWREELFKLIGDTPDLDWLLLTKRPQNAERMIFEAVGEETWGEGWANVWLGATVENRKEQERRVAVLRSTPARIHFLSCEPLLEDISDFDFEGIDWIICGGESGPKRRPTNIEHHRALRDMAAAQGIAFFEKQIDKKIPIPDDLMVRQFPGGV